jgi:phage-related protein (TIGR01555 family)
MTETEKPASTDLVTVQNSLCTLLDNLTIQHQFTGGAQVSQSDTMYYNTRWYMVSNNRQLLSQMYVEHGLVQTLCDQPVDDAFRAGFEIKSSQLDGNDIELIHRYFQKNHVIKSLKQALKWARLYGGGGVLLITPQDPEKPFTLESLRDQTPIIFQPVDMWELYQDKINIQGDLHPSQNNDEFYHYYGKRVHKSRLMRFNGKEPPSFVRPRLRGWGMSELERLVRSINQYLKNQDVVFELLDEAKIDVYKIKGFNNSLLNALGTNTIASRITFANMLKNYNHALTMDKEDDYVQKQINFSGLNDILEQIRIGVACDLKMPVSKLFGISVAGFGSGEDEIENYNSMIEGEIREPAKAPLLELIGIACQQLFGFAPDDLDTIWNPLRILNAEQEEKVKDSQFNRVMSAFQSGLADALTAKKAINKDSLLGVEIDETDEVFTPPVPGGDFTVGGGGDKVGEGKDSKDLKSTTKKEK